MHHLHLGVGVESGRISPHPRRFTLNPALSLRNVLRVGFLDEGEERERERGREGERLYDSGVDSCRD